MTKERLLDVTPEAIKQIRALAQADGLTDVKLRVELAGGAPSGFAYDLYFDDLRSDDEVIEEDGVCIVVDPDSAAYLKGSTVDWIEGDNGAGFQVRNPNEPEK